MKPFHLFLPDFRLLVISKRFKSTENVHPVMYYETEEFIRFYKPVGSVVYATTILQGDVLPEGITIRQLKRDFEAYEVPVQPDAPKIINGTIN